MMERTGSTAYPEIQTQDEQGAWELGGKGYLAVQSCEDGWDYTLYHSDYSVMDGGQIDAPELTVQEVREQILEAHHMEKGRRLLLDYDADGKGCRSRGTWTGQPPFHLGKAGRTGWCKRKVRCPGVQSHRLPESEG